MKKPSRGCLWTLGVLCALVVGLYIADKLIPPKAVRCLPEGATEIQENYKVVGLTADFVRVLKARIPKEQVAEYARKVGAIYPEQGGAGRDYIGWTGPAWFSPTEPPLFYYSEKDSVILVGWEKGYVYFCAAAW